MQRGNIIAENNEFKGNRGDGKISIENLFQEIYNRKSENLKDTELKNKG